MAMRPGQDSEFDFCLTDSRSKDEWYLTLDGGGRSVQRSSLSEDQFGLYIRNVGKQIGGFDEQRDWSGGRGGEFFSEDARRFFDSQNCWTLNGHVTPTLQWKYATGYRVVDQLQWGNVQFVPAYIAGGQRYVSGSFVAGANNTTDKCWMLIKRVGNPPTGTFYLCPNTGSVPDFAGALKSKTVTTTEITDKISVYYAFDYTSTQAITSGTTYWVVFDGGLGDENNHWEIGVSTAASGKTATTDTTSWTTSSFAPYFRLTDADTDRRWFFFGNGTTFLAVDKKASGASQVYVIASGACTEKTTSGLGTVLSRPISSNAYYYFPQGESVNVREFDGTSTWADDGSNKATFLVNGYDSADGAVIWRANTTVGTVSSVSRAKVTTGGTDHTFNTAIPIGDLVGSINGMTFDTNNGLWVGKSESVWQVLNDRAILQNFGVEKTPSTTNGQAFASLQQFLYFNWLFSDERLYGGTLDDIGQGWRGPALPNGKEGTTAVYCSYVNWLFKAIDAGASGTSTVQTWDGLGWHPIFQAPAAGLRIRDLAIQVVAGSRPRLWIDCGGDLIYMDLPLNKANPLYDTTINYYHEGVLTSSTIDMGTASRLPKFIRDITATTANLNGGGIRIELDYQLDQKCGLDGIANWTTAPDAFLNSPEDLVEIFRSATQFRYRLRLMTNDSDVPPDLKSILPSGYARTPYRLTWSMRIAIGQSQASEGLEPKADDFDAWLMDAAREPGRITMTSKWRNLHGMRPEGRKVVISPATAFPISAMQENQQEETVYTLTVLEV